MSILIKKSGILTTVQDLGRSGFRRFGINPNGAMDKIAARLINSLLGNDENAPVLEMHYPASEILFEEDSLFALGGADFSAQLNEKSCENWRIIVAEKGSILKFKQKHSGNRAYLAIKGGFRIVNWLGSASTNLIAKIGGFDGRKLLNGDRIEFNFKFQISNFKFNYRISTSLIPFYSKLPIIQVVSGAEFNELTVNSFDIFTKENFTLTQNSDRMGFRLKGSKLQLKNPKEIISSAVNFGTIQLLPNGQLIVLMADHQTSGGYPRIANVIPTDFPIFAQLGTNEKVAFQMISIEKAENLLFEFEKSLQLLKSAVKFL